MNMRNRFFKVPKEQWLRLHFVRPRFKSNIENVLLYMANECCRVPDCSCSEYNNRYMTAIRMFPGNQGMSDKTLQNWRTEIPALFGFYKEDKQHDITSTSQMAFFLHEHQDLTQFMRLFLYTFQFPGGHLKPQELVKLIANNVRFKPARTIVKVLMAGNELLAKEGVESEMSITAEEATYCIFNDLRVTSGQMSETEIARTILHNRRNHLKYYSREDRCVFSSRGVPRSKGDIIRYAGDILDYMELANLLDKQYEYYSLKANERETINAFANDTSWFDGYEKFYKKKRLDVGKVGNVEPMWFDYVSDTMDPKLFKTDLSSVFAENEYKVIVDERISDVLNRKNRTTKDIGNLGEALICGHERMRIRLSGHEEFVKLVQIVDSPSYHPGYDIDSFEADGTDEHRYIEVKTTISKKKIDLYNFHMSTNEWRVAKTIKEHYCVYRLMLSYEDKTLIVLRNPFALYSKEKIDAVPRDGMEVSFDSKLFNPTELLIWNE